MECLETSPVIRSLRVEVDAERVQKAFDRLYTELRRTARVKGFRPGKVPRAVLERMYGSSAPEEVERALVSETLAAAIHESGVLPLGEPDVDAETPAPGAAFHYTARVEVRPAITLPDPAQLRGRKPIVRVSDEEIDAELERLREHHVALVEEPEGTPAVNDHVVTLDFTGTVDGEPFPGGSAKGVDIRLGTGTMVPGFEEQLVGVRAGEDRRLSVTFPQDYGRAELAGKQAEFECHVVAVRRRELPALDDELAKDVGEFESLAELRARIASDRRKRKETAAERALHQSLMESLLALTTFEVPPGVVERQLQGQLRSLHDQFQGRVPHEVLVQQLRRMQEDGRPVAERRVREAFLLQAIVEREQLRATPEEIDARLAEMAGAQGMELAKLRSAAQEQGWLGALEHELVEQRAYAWLAERANVEEVEADSATETDGDSATEVDSDSDGHSVG
ncbi:MAG TPA: trigger factor [Planctomycetota bacterium]|nr:trigger factor [Planctomycetota bacterium]